jgi:protein-S-isoprenylcysteine O-methyltransferase Ste14
MVNSLLVAIFWTIFIAIWLISALGSKKKQTNSSMSTWWKDAALRTFIIAMIVLFFGSKLNSSDFRNLSSFGPVLSSLGVIICAMGLGFAIWARFLLGKVWSMPAPAKKEPELITTGPYAYVRHPIYTGITFAMFGTFLASTFIWGIPLVIFCVYFIYSAHKDEKLMLKEFPKQYPDYTKKTKMLIPYLY